ncbi:MAG: hypothetical protein ACFE8L_10710 [Candidatus Hodarchaeota archaeon]
MTLSTMIIIRNLGYFLDGFDDMHHREFLQILLGHADRLDRVFIIIYFIQISLQKD